MHNMRFYDSYYHSLFVEFSFHLRLHTGAIVLITFVLNLNYTVFCSSRASFTVSALEMRGKREVIKY